MKRILLYSTSLLFHFYSATLKKFFLLILFASAFFLKAAAQEPTVQASAVTFSAITTNSMTVGWTNGDGAERIVLIKAVSAVDSDPVDATSYTADPIFSNGSQIGTGNYVAYLGNSNSVNVTGLAAGITYHVAVYELNGSAGTEDYLLTAATANQITLSAEPTIQTSAVTFSAVTTTGMTVNFTAGDGAQRIVVVKSGSAVDSDPVDGTTYTPSATFTGGTQIGTGNYVMYVNNGNSVAITGLTAGVTYHVAVYELKGAAGSENYLQTAATGSQVTLATEPTAQANTMTFTAVGTVTTTVNWVQPGAGGGAEVIVVARAGGYPSANGGTPVDGTTYTGNAAFASGTQIGTGNYVIYRGTSATTNVPVTALNAGTTYYYEVYQLNGSGGAENYYTAGPLQGNQVTLSAQPTVQAFAVNFTAITTTGMTINFTAGNGAQRIVLVKSGSAVSSDPVYGTTYTPNTVFTGGTQIGAGNYVMYVNNGNSVAITGLTPGIVYHVAVYELNGSAGSENYLLTPATGSQVTLSAPPTVQASAVNFSSVTTTGMTINFTVGNGAQRIVLVKSGSAVSSNPVSGTTYTPNTVFTGGTQIGAGNYVMYVNNGNSVAITGLTPGVVYHVAVYELNGSAGSENYLLTPATGSQVTLSGPPTVQTSAITFSAVSATGMTIGFTPGDGAQRIVLVKSGSAVSSNPVNGTTYTPNTVFTSGTQIGTGNYVMYVNSGNSVAITGLTPGVIYHVAVYELNGGAGSESYLTTSPLTGSQTTLSSPPTAQASAVNFTAIAQTTTTVNWTHPGAGGGTNVIVVARPAGYPSANGGTPVNGTGYTGNAAFGSGTQIGTGNYVVFNGPSSTTSVAVTGLSSFTSYYYEVYEYNGAAGSQNYLVSPIGQGIQATTTYKYYSKATALAANLTTSWVLDTVTNLGNPPNFSSGDTFVIRVSHAMTTTATWAVTGTGNKVEISGSGTLTATFLVACNSFEIKPSGTYIHNYGIIANGIATDIPGSVTRIFSNGGTGAGNNGTVEIQKWGDGTGGGPVQLPSGVTWGNLKINVTTAMGGSWNQQGAVTTINGDLSVLSLGSGTQREFRLYAGTGGTTNVGGNVNVSNVGLFTVVSGGSTANFNVTGNVLVTGGTFAPSGSNTSNFVMDITGNYTVSGGNVTSTTAPTQNCRVRSNMLINGGTYSLSSGGSTSVPFLQVDGSLTISSGSMTGTSTQSWTITVLGDFILSGGTFQACTNSTQAGRNYNLNIGGNYNHTAGGILTGSWTNDATQLFNITFTGGASSSVTYTMTGTVTANRITNFIVDNGKELRLNNDVTLYAATNIGTYTVNGGGTLNCISNIVQGTNAAFYLLAGGTLKIGDVNGITAALATLTGSVRTTGVRSFLTTANYEYNNATTAQLAGTGLPTTVNNLTINNGSATGVTLNNANVLVSNQLIFTTGKLNTGVFKVSIPTTGSIVTPSSTKYVNGFLEKFLPVNTTTVTYEIGGSTTYAPVTLTFSGGGTTSGGTGNSITASTPDGDHPQIASSGINNTLSVNRSWTLTNSGVTFGTYSAVFNFVTGDKDAAANTANFVAGRYFSSAWTLPTVGTKTANSTQVTGLTGFGDFQLGETGPVITTGTITGSPFCAGATVSVPYTLSGTFTAGNVFTAQLSDASGSFAAPVAIGSFTGTTNTTISGTIPAGTATGAAYRIRVVSSIPTVNGSDNGVNITINGLPTITLVSGFGTVTPGAPTASSTYTSTNSPDRYSIVWTGAAPAAGFVDVTNAVLSASPLVVAISVNAAASPTVYTANLTVSNSVTGCSNTTPVTLTITMGASPASIAYYWVGGTSGNFTDQTSWSTSVGGAPVGTSSTINFTNKHVLIFDGSDISSTAGLQTGAVAATISAAATIGQFVARANANATVSSNSASAFTLTVSNLAAGLLSNGFTTFAPDITITSGSTFNLSSTAAGNFTTTLAASATADISGTYNVNANTTFTNANTGTSVTVAITTGTFNINATGLVAQATNGGANNGTYITGTPTLGVTTNGLCTVNGNMNVYGYYLHGASNNVTVGVSANITFQNFGVYEANSGVASGTGITTLPTTNGAANGTWKTGSTIIISSVRSGTAGFSLTNAVHYYNIYYNYTGQAGDVYLSLVASPDLYIDGYFTVASTNLIMANRALKFMQGGAGSIFSLQVAGDFTATSTTTELRMSNSGTYTSAILKFGKSFTVTAAAFNISNLANLLTCEFYGTGNINTDFGFRGFTAANATTGVWVKTGANYTLSQTLALANNTVGGFNDVLNIDGTLDCAGFQVTGGAATTVNVNSGGTVKTMLTVGMTGAASTGVFPTNLWKTVGGINLKTGSNYVFYSNAGSGTPQSTGFGSILGANIPASITIQTTNNTNVNLDANITIGIAGATPPALTLNTTGGGIFNIGNFSLGFVNTDIPILKTAGTITAGAGSSLVFGTAGNTAGAAFTLPNTVFTSAPTITNFTINRTNALSLSNQNITLSGVLTLTSGLLTTSSSGMIIISVTGSTTAGSATSYVNGPMQITSQASLTPAAMYYPIGKGGGFRPQTLTVVHDAAASNVYQAEIFAAAPPARTLPATLSAVSTTYYATISKISGAANITGTTNTLLMTYGTVGFNDNVTNRFQIRVAKSNGGAWVDQGGIGTANTTGTITSTINFTALGDFVIASATTPTVTLTTPSQVAAGNIPINSVKNPVYVFQLAVTGSNAAVNNISFTTVNTAAGDIVRYQLYYNTSNTFPASGGQIGADIVAGGSGTYAFTATSLVTIPAATTGYFWITADVVASLGVIGHQVTVTPALNGPVDFTLGFGTVTNGAPLTAGGTQTIVDGTLTTDYFQSRATGFWNIANSWESSHTSGAGPWITATNPPTFTANTIVILAPHTITDTSAVSLDQTTINGILIVKKDATNAGTLNINDGTGIDIDITTGGKLIVDGPNTGPANYNNTFVYSAGTARINVNTGAYIVIGTGPTAQGSNFWQLATTPTNEVIWNDAAIFEWNTTNTFGTNGVTYFPNANAATIPVFRVSQTIGLPNGAIAATGINGLFEANGALSFQTSGTKTFRNGIIGTAAITQSATSGQFIISGTAKLGGTGAINLDVAGLSVATASVTTMISDKTINSGPVTINGMLDASTYKIPGTANAFVISSTGTVKTSNANGFSGGANTTLVNTITGIDASAGTVDYYAASGQVITAGNYGILTNSGNGDRTLASAGVIGIKSSFSTGTGFYTVTGSSVNFYSTGAQNVPPLKTSSAFPYINQYNILTVSGGNTKSITANMTILDSLKIDNSTTLQLNNNDTVTIRSTAAKTARIGLITAGAAVTYANSNSKFVIERYYPLKRTWRLVTSPVDETTGPTINEAWQEGNSPSVGLFGVGVTNYNVHPGYGTHITGPYDVTTPYNSLVTTSGFDQSPQNRSSMRYYTNATDTWDPVDNTNVHKVGYKQGYLLFVRGDRSYPIDRTTNLTTPAAATLRTTGKIKTGTVDVPFTGLAIQVMGNPYASAIRFGSNMLTNNSSKVNSNFSLYDPLKGANDGSPVNTGGFIQIAFTPPSDYTSTYAQWLDASSNAHPFDSSRIPSGAAFLIDSKVASNSFRITEEDKIDSSKNDLFRPFDVVLPKLRSILYALDGNGDPLYWADASVAIFDDAFSNGVDWSEDVKKVLSTTENVSISRDGNLIAIEKRKPVSAVADTIFQAFSNLKLGNYRFDFIATDWNRPDLQGFVEDAYTGTRTPFNTYGTTTVPFTITAIPGAWAADRFRIVFGPAGGPLPVRFTTVKAWQQNRDIAVEWKVANEINIKEYEVERSTDGRSFNKMATTAAKGNTTGNITYNWLDQSPVTGVNYYRIRSIGNDAAAKYSQVVKVTIGKGTPGIAIYPNPVKNGAIGLQLNQMPQGVYQLRVLNTVGQLLQTDKITHTGGTATQTIQLKGFLPKGTYQLEIKAQDGTVIVLPLMLE